MNSWIEPIRNREDLLISPSIGPGGGVGFFPAPMNSLAWKYAEGYFERPGEYAADRALRIGDRTRFRGRAGRSLRE